MKLRLHYERRTWPGNFKRIQDLCQNIARDSGRINTNLQTVISNASAVGVEGIFQRMNHLLRQDLVELHRLLGYQVRYSQYLAAEALIGTADRPGKLGKSIGILREHLEATSQGTGTVLLRLGDIKKTTQDCEAIYVSILAEKNGLDKVLQLFRGEAEAEEGSSTRGPLAFVPIVRRKIQEDTDLQRAALHAFLQISDPKLARIVRTWINILAINEDLRNETSQAIDEVIGMTVAEVRRARDEQTGLALAVRFLDRMEQLEANDARGLKRGLENDQLDTKLQDALDNSGITDSRTYKQSFTQAEQTQIKRRRGG
ncbi:hypothetical protein KVR01_000921 [Diaporthe batatas]|uniref:uncharacterized protein n=1 Tax=Diaporthe batatas TaxID=748121 RepID=UPI001D04FE13|nr:uncharacterized protein KVR01_000921 [Diaporthe batatas]KAG8170176.1 hypothetical protein KVR01_000921 [Diaporthe batatas]